jgi:hypothetical protein
MTILKIKYQLYVAVGSEPPLLVRTSRCALVMGIDSFKVAVKLYHFVKQFILAYRKLVAAASHALPECYRHRLITDFAEIPDEWRPQLMRDGSNESSLILPSTHYASKSSKGRGLLVTLKCPGWLAAACDGIFCWTWNILFLRLLL